MNREEYFKFHKEMQEKMYAVTLQKNRDYAGPDGDDPFSNFSRVSSVGICGVEQGFLVRMLDKICRINSFVQAGTLHVKDESVEDTLMDLANYSILFAGYLKSKKSVVPDIPYPPKLSIAEAFGRVPPPQIAWESKMCVRCCGPINGPIWMQDNLNYHIACKP